MYIYICTFALLCRFQVALKIQSIVIGHKVNTYLVDLMIGPVTRSQV